MSTREESLGAEILRLVNKVEAENVKLKEKLDVLGESFKLIGKVHEAVKKASLPLAEENLRFKAQLDQALATITKLERKVETGEELLEDLPRILAENAKLTHRLVDLNQNRMCDVAIIGKQAVKLRMATEAFEIMLAKMRDNMSDLPDAVYDWIRQRCTDAITAIQEGL